MDCMKCSFKTKQNLLRVLPCKHYFCIECLYQIQGTHLISCFICSMEFQIPERNILEFSIPDGKRKREDSTDDLELKCNSEQDNWPFLARLTRDLKLDLGSIYRGDCFCILGDTFYYRYKNEYEICRYPIPRKDADYYDPQKKLCSLDVTYNALYAIEADSGKLVFTKIPLPDEEDLFFETFDSGQYSKVKAKEDWNNKDFVLAFSVMSRRCTYFHEGSRKWVTTLDCKDLGCILGDGNPIVKKLNSDFALLDKNTGDQLKCFNSPGNTQIYEVYPMGVVVVQKQRLPSDIKCYILDYSMEMFLYDYNFKKIQKLSKFYDVDFITTGRNGKIYLLHIQSQMRAYNLSFYREVKNNNKKKIF